MSETRLEPDLDDLLWSTVNLFHRAVDRIGRELDDNEQAQQKSQREQNGSEVRSVELERLTAEGITLIERRNAMELFRDQAAERFEVHTGSSWRPRSGSLVNHRTLTAAMIDSRDFLAARRRAETEVMLPAGPKIALTGGLDFNDHRLIWDRLDKVTAGDREAFRRTLDPDGLFSDEEGNVRSGAVLVEEVRGLPPGYVGNLRLVDPHTRVRGDAGVVAYDVAETLDLFGQRLNTRFHTTDIYRRTNEGWRLMASQTTVIPNELPRFAIDPAVFDDYAGTYRLSAEVRARVWREGNRLIMDRAGRGREELIPIGNDRFVRAGAPRGERFFRRNGEGRVVELVDRRDNNDLIWNRD